MQKLKRNWYLVLAIILLAATFCSSGFNSSVKFSAFLDVPSFTGEVSTKEENQNKHLILSHSLIQLHVREQSANPFTSGDLTGIDLDFQLEIATLLESLTDVPDLSKLTLSLLLFPFHSHW
jgi:hypothetical protein